MAYFDASGSPSDRPVLCLGGLVSTAEKWITFSKQWGECLEAFEVSALHMKDFTSFRGEFASWRWDEPRRKRLLSGLIQVIEGHIEYTVASTVLMEHYKAVDGKYHLSEFMRPYTLAASSCVGAISLWARNASYDPDGIGYIFERGDADQSDVARCWESQFPDMRISPVFLKKRDKHPNPDVYAPIRPFEAADLIAYENYKANVQLEDQETESVDLDQLRKPLQRLLNLPGAKEQWRYSRTSEMEAVCSMYQVPLR